MREGPHSNAHGESLYPLWQRTTIESRNVWSAPSAPFLYSLQPSARPSAVATTTTTHSFSRIRHTNPARLLTFAVLSTHFEALLHDSSSNDRPERCTLSPRSRKYYQNNIPQRIQTPYLRKIQSSYDNNYSFSHDQIIHQSVPRSNKANVYLAKIHSIWHIADDRISLLASSS